LTGQQPGDEKQIRCRPIIAGQVPNLRGTCDAPSGEAAIRCDELSGGEPCRVSEWRRHQLASECIPDANCAAFFDGQYPKTISTERSVDDLFVVFERRERQPPAGFRLPEQRGEIFAAGHDALSLW